MSASARKWVALLCIAAILCLALAPLDGTLAVAILTPQWIFLYVVALLYFLPIRKVQHRTLNAIIPVLAQRPPPAA